MTERQNEEQPKLTSADMIFEDIFGPLRDSSESNNQIIKNDSLEFKIRPGKPLSAYLYEAEQEGKED